MYKTNISYLLLIVFLIVSCNRKTTPSAQTSNFPEKLSVIAFGSCNKQNKPQPLWEAIIQNKPDLWIWLGDNIYADTEDMNLMRQKYEMQLEHTDYKKLLNTCQVIGTWDDHDYGENDGGKDFLKKEESKEHILNFLHVAQDAEVRKRPGIYQSYTIGKSPRQVKIILLDTRSFKDDIERKKEIGYIPDENAEILGNAQWQWLEKELSNNAADLTIIANGTQFLPEEHKYEKWANFPTERNRFINLLDETQSKNVFLLSGDRHFGEISSLTTPNNKIPIYEVTSSGMTHSYASLKDEPNQHRVGNFTGQLNFGLMLIEWDSPVPNVHLQLRGENNAIREDVQVELN